LEIIPAAEDPDSLVVDLDSVDDRMDLTLPGLASALSSFSFIRRANVLIFSASITARVPHWARAWSSAA
jgi:hypothetical protein